MGPGARFLGVMGIVNVTPDSFSDGGRWMDSQQAIGHAVRLASDGASCVDVGGESTRPGAARVGDAEQIDRVAPVIEGIVRRCGVPVSVDTTRTVVAAAAIQAGASIINDVAAGDEGETMELAARHHCGLVLMHRLAPPGADSRSDRYVHPPGYKDGDVVGDVAEWLEERARRALGLGVQRERLWLDPGFGFGKTVEQNFALLDGIARIVALGFPVLLSVSRKSSVGARYDIPDPQARDEPSIALAVSAVAQGVAVIRAHDVAGHVRALAGGAVARP